MPLKSQIISFVLDGNIVNIDFQKCNLSPTHSLLHYLRSLPNHKGVKEGCGEGDCGACTVVIGELDKNNKIIYKAIDSCLVFLPMIHGKQVITIENLAFEKGGKTILHPIQEAMVFENGTQCGFCTPGFIMSLFSLYKNFENPKPHVIKNALSGNLCRCTGYNSIIKATQKVFKNKKDDHFTKEENNIISLLKKINNKKIININTEEQVYIKPFTLKEALDLKNKLPQALIISGATDCALRVTKKHEIIPYIIDISEVVELKTITKNTKGYVFGAAAKLEEIRMEGEKGLKTLFEILSVFGSKQIRNLATLGGNVGSASPIGDTLPVLLAYNASVLLQSVDGKRTIPLSDFIIGYRKTQILPHELITAISVPKPDKDIIIKSYKISKRKALDISTVSVCFRLKLNNNIVEDIMIAYGGMAAYTKRAFMTENYLINKKWSEKTISEAVNFIKKDFTPISDARAGKEMRLIAAGNLLLKFYNDTQN